MGLYILVLFELFQLSSWSGVTGLNALSGPGAVGFELVIGAGLPVVPGIFLPRPPPGPL